MDKRLNIEGSPASKMVQLIRKHGYNRDIGLEVGTVTASPPNITVKLNDGIELDSDDIVLTQTAYDAGLVVGDSVVILSDEDALTYYVIDKVVT